MDLEIPSYWLPRPAFDLDEATRQAFDALLDSSIARGADLPIHYALEAPRWAFLCYAADERGLAMHGSQDAHISEFEPRQANDLREFGAQKAVYAAADGIWAMYFGIVDRARYRMSIINACIRVEIPEGIFSPPLYFFSIPRRLRDLHPYTNGMVYLLPGETFEHDSPMAFGPARVHAAQLASRSPVRPLAKLAVEPEDFPFLAQMRLHDDEHLEDYARALSMGLPWPGDEPGG